MRELVLRGASLVPAVLVCAVLAVAAYRYIREEMKMLFYCLAAILTFGFFTVLIFSLAEYGLTGEWTGPLDR